HHPEFGEHAGFRPVQSFTDRGEQRIDFSDEYYLHFSAGAEVARLLDCDTVRLLLRRTQLVTRMGILNFLLMVAAAFRFSDTIIQNSASTPAFGPFSRSPTEASSELTSATSITCTSPLARRWHGCSTPILSGCCFAGPSWSHAWGF